MTDTIRQCWAFHRDGMRCEHPAGHAGDHAVQKTWTDLQCATPGEFEPTPHKVQPALSVTDMSAAPVPTPPTKCAACMHAHRDGECKCGCYSFIG